MEKKKITLEEVQVLIEKFVPKHRDFLDKIDIVIGVSRGGLVPAALLAAKTDKPLVAAYIDKRDEIHFDRPEWINGKKVLVVDDVIRSGKTLWLLKKSLEKNTAPGSTEFFTLFKVLTLVNNKFSIKVFSREINEDVIFPWDN
jgi:hypoxanthine phosphoribosyltransferase